MNNTPAHVAIIMDGNGRWAQSKGLPRSYGHREGIKRVEEIVDCASRMGVKMLTFFAFSTENWSRPKREVGMLIRLLYKFLSDRVDKFQSRNIRFLTIGKENNLPPYLLERLRQTQKKTGNNTGMTVLLAFNYGSRQEIVDAASRIAREAVQRGRAPDDLDADKFSGYLYTAGMPDPDLLIRTSGEMRLSNFLLWQLSYAELYFTNKYWPDFAAGDFEKAVKNYRRRKRRFGAVSERD